MMVLMEENCVIESEGGNPIVPRQSLPSYFADITKTYIFENKLKN